VLFLYMESVAHGVTSELQLGHAGQGSDAVTTSQDVPCPLRVHGASHSGPQWMGSDPTPVNVLLATTTPVMTTGPSNHWGRYLCSEAKAR
jgi:hypothetical protein